MTDTNKMIAIWAGWYKEDHHGWYAEKSDLTYLFNQDDAEIPLSAAIELLPVLVEKGYEVGLVKSTETQGNWIFMAGKRKPDGSIVDVESAKPTISAAITSAIIALVEKGEQG
jgi:hypothetical protein